MRALSREDFAILDSLDETGGFDTRRVSLRAFQNTSNRRIVSGETRRWLLRLKADGLVQLMDDQKPDCWQRTPAGTEALVKAVSCP